MDFKFEKKLPKGIDEENPMVPAVMAISTFETVMNLASDRLEAQGKELRNAEVSAFNILTGRSFAMYALFKFAGEDQALTALRRSVNEEIDIDAGFIDGKVVLTPDDIRKSLANSRHLAKTLQDILGTGSIRATGAPEGAFIKLNNAVKDIEGLAERIGIDISMPTSMIANLANSIKQIFPDRGPGGGKGKTIAA